MNGFWNREWKLERGSPIVAIKSTFMNSKDYVITFHMS